MTVPVPSQTERIRALLVNVGERRNCRGCAAPIYWITHRNGKKTPYDAEGETAGVNHFVTCPRREQFKRG